MKKQVLIGLLGVLMISILPGCGKKKNDEPIGVGVVAPVNTPPLPVNGGVGGCYSTSGIFGAGLTLGFSGVLSGTSSSYPMSGYSLGGYSSTSGITANLSLYGAVSSIPGGYTNTYNRSNTAGDLVQVAINGNSVYVQVSLHQNSVAAINTYYGGQICGFYMNVGILGSSISGPGWTGNIGGGPIGVHNGQYILQL